MRLFLTGGTGFIGQAFVRAARRRGWSLAALVRDPGTTQARWIASQGCDLVPGDVTQPDGLRGVLKGVDVLLHNAGVYELGASRAERRRMHLVNVQGTDNVLRAAAEDGVPRTVYVSSAWALGPTGGERRAEPHGRPGRYLSPYEESKVLAHGVALLWRARGLPLVAALPNAVVGANDHSVFGHFLRLYLLGAMPPMAFGLDAVYAVVDVLALAEGLCLAVERAPMGEDFLFCGEAEPLRATFQRWRRYPGGSRRTVAVPRWLMMPLLAPLEPLQRRLGLPAFLSRDTVRASRGSLDYSASRTMRELGWTHPPADEMWDRIIGEERALMSRRNGFLGRLRHQAIVEA